MQPSARDTFLETQVMTASPQKLRLMLVEGAIRNVNQVQHYWDLQRLEDALEASIRAREIISELMSPLSADKSPLAMQMLAVYVYLFRTLTEGTLENDRAKLADVLRVLGEERETWSQVCEKFVDIDEKPQAKAEITAPQTLATVEEQPTASAPLGFDSDRVSAAPVPPPMSARHHPAPGRTAAFPGVSTPAPAQGFSFEA